MDLSSTHRSFACWRNAPGGLAASCCSVAQLHGELCIEVEPDERPYLYIGSTERQSEFRPELAEDLDSVHAPWLQKVASGPGTRWGLSRIDLNACPR